MPKTIYLKPKQALFIDKNVKGFIKILNTKKTHHISAPFKVFCMNQITQPKHRNTSQP